MSSSISTRQSPRSHLQRADLQQPEVCVSGRPARHSRHRRAPAAGRFADDQDPGQRHRHAGRFRLEKRFVPGPPAGCQPDRTGSGENRSEAGRGDDVGDHDPPGKAITACGAARHPITGVLNRVAVPGGPRTTSAVRPQSAGRAGSPRAGPAFFSGFLRYQAQVPA